MSNIGNWVDRIPSTTNEKMDELFGNTFYHSGLPFRFADSESLKQFLFYIRPAYNVPSSKKVAGSLLNKAHSKFIDYVEDCLNSSSHIYLVSDGWSFMMKDHYVNHIALFGKKSIPPILYCCTNTGEIAQTGENIALETISVINEIGSEKVVSLVTDNASNMKTAWKILRENYPKLIINGCAAHTINLLVKDICKLDEYESTMTDCRFVTAFVNDRNILSTRFGSLQVGLFESETNLQSKRKLVFVSDTRWYTHHACVKRILENKLVLKQLIHTTAFNDIQQTRELAIKKKRFYSLIDDGAFWDRVQVAESILRPTSKAVGLLESDSCCISDIYRLFLDLLDGYCQIPAILELVNDRWAFLHTESMASAYFLDPKTKAGEGFIGNDLYDCDINLKDYIPRNNFAGSIQDIEDELELYVEHMKNLSVKEAEYIQTKSAMTYWLTVGAAKFPILFCVAKIVLNVPTSQAAAERTWSMYDFILTKRRNSLKPAKVTKLVQLYMNAGLKDQKVDLLAVMMGLENDCGTDSQSDIDNNE